MTQSGGNSIEIPHFAPYQFREMLVSERFAGLASNRVSLKWSIAFAEYPNDGRYRCYAGMDEYGWGRRTIARDRVQIIQGEDMRVGHQVSPGTRDESWRFRNAHAPLTSTTRIKPAELCKLPGSSVSLGLRAISSDCLPARRTSRPRRRCKSKGSARSG
jgi:hypothetical protein